MKIPDQVVLAAEQAAERQGCFLWDIEFVREAGENYLRVHIDNEAAQIDISQCEAVSRELDAKLDELDPIPDAYILEVCSAGAERALKRPADFQRFLGSTVAVRLYSSKAGRKEHVGVLAGYENGDVLLEGGLRFAAAEVAQVRLRVTF